MFRSYKIYIQIGRNRVTVVNLNTGAEATHTATKPFSTPRSVLSSFSPANETLMAAMHDLGIKSSFIRLKAVIQQLEDTDGGLTDIEKRALRDLAENAGAGKVYIAEGAQLLTAKEALAYIEGV
jgi:actin-like ATPase involved in cell morphogenesis